MLLLFHVTEEEKLRGFSELFKLTELLSKNLASSKIPKYLLRCPRP